MRILICAQEAPLPPPNGFRLALVELLAQLRRRHDVRVLALRASDQPSTTDEAHVSLVEPPSRSGRADTYRLIRARIERRPHLAEAMATQLREPLTAELRDFRPDVVHVSAGQLAGLWPQLLGHPAVLAALDAMHLNIEAKLLGAAGVRKLLLRGELANTRRFEADEFRHFGRVVLVSPEDAAALEHLDDAIRTAVIPNGVDTDRYRPAPTAKRSSCRIVFTGAMSYPPNVVAAEFLARRLFPLVRSRRPDAELAIVGRRPTGAVRTLASLDGVVVTGEVPDLVPWLTTSALYVCPMLSGTGIKNKLLEAMACGLPCVATPLALRGLSATPGVHVLVGNTEAELADHVVRLLEDPRAASDLGEAARAYVEQSHDWRRVGAAYERVYEEEIERGTG